MEVRKRQLIDQAARVGKLAFGHPRKTHHDVGSKGGMREESPQFDDEFGVLTRSVRTPHLPQDARVPALQRNMKMGADPLPPSEMGNEGVTPFPGFEGAQAHARGPGTLMQPSQERREVLPGRQIFAPLAQMDARKDDLAVSVCHKTFHLHADLG